MILIVGGRAQGKRRFAEESLGVPAEAFADGATAAPEELLAAKAVDRFHLALRRALADGMTEEEILGRLAEMDGEAVVLADEVGCGIVPVDAFERRYRDLVGRACQRIAAQASEVYRVVCGVGSCIKKG